MFILMYNRAASQYFKHNIMKVFSKAVTVMQQKTVESIKSKRYGSTVIRYAIEITD